MSLQASPIPVARHLLVFARHPELGRVKTRLAASVGPEAALAVYQELLAHTRAVIHALPVHKTVWLAEQPGVEALASVPDPWPQYQQAVQPPGDLGAKMQTAFAAAFAAGATAAVIIGTDCPGLNSTILDEAYEALDTHSVVVGPAEDGGYYLLGMSNLYVEFFQDKTWSSATVLRDTLADVSQLGLTVAMLATLRDVDDLEDLQVWRAAEKQAE